MHINETATAVHALARTKGFYDNNVNVGEKLMLAVSEIGEALEAHRKEKFAQIQHFETILSKSRIINQDPTYNGAITPEAAYKAHFEILIKDSFEDEMADAVIRLFDLAAYMNIDLEKHIAWKTKYNETRPKFHGKKY